MEGIPAGGEEVDEMIEDLQYLKLLSIFHYVFGGVGALFASIPIIYVIIGMLAFFIPGPIHFESESLPAFIGLLFIIFGASLIVLGWTLSACIIIAGRYLARKRHYMFCIVVAALECMCMPFGTVLGVFTIIVLSRPAVRELFEQKATPKPMAGGGPLANSSAGA
jgi:hypothetical protein